MRSNRSEPQSREAGEVRLRRRQALGNHGWEASEVTVLELRAAGEGSRSNMCQQEMGWFALTGPLTVCGASTAI